MEKTTDIYIDTQTNNSFSKGHVTEYSTMHYFGIPRHTKTMIAYKILTEYFWKIKIKIALCECC